MGGVVSCCYVRIRIALNKTAATITLLYPATDEQGVVPTSALKNGMKLTTLSESTLPGATTLTVVG